MKFKGSAGKKTKKINLFAKYFKPILFFTVVIIFSIAYFLFLSPLISKYHELSDQTIKEKRENLDKQKKIFSELSKINKIYNQVTPYLKDKVSELLPSQPDLPNLYYTLDQLTRDGGYKMLSISIEVPKEKQKTSHRQASNQANKSESLTQEQGINGAESEGLSKTEKSLREIGITLSLEGGGYLAFKDFLDLLEHNLRILDVESFSYNPKETDIELRLKTYYYR